MVRGVKECIVRVMKNDKRQDGAEVQRDSRHKPQT
jgi:hypothetical protein